MKKHEFQCWMTVSPFLLLDLPSAMSKVAWTVNKINTQAVLCLPIQKIQRVPLPPVVASYPGFLKIVPDWPPKECNLVKYMTWIKTKKTHLDICSCSSWQTMPVGEWFRREHIATMKVVTIANDEAKSIGIACPCTKTNAPFTGVVPPFIEQDYFCMWYTGSRYAAQFQWYHAVPLWNGLGCGPTCIPTVASTTHPDSTTTNHQWHWDEGLHRRNNC